MIWTPKLERLLEDEAAFEVKNKKIGLNPKEPTLVSCLRIAFRVAVKGNAYNEICDIMGLDRKNYADNTRQMADLAEANNRPDIAKLLRQALYVSQEAARLYPKNENESGLKTGLERIRTGKRGEIEFGPEA